MSLKTRVKVSHLSNLSDARYCAGMGVDLLGFAAIEGSEFYLPPDVFQDIRGWIAGPTIVAELYGASSAGQIRDVIQTYAPDCLELGIDEYKKFRDDLSLPAIVSVSDLKEIAEIPRASNISHVLVEKYSGAGDLASSPYPVIIKVGDVNKLRETLQVAALGGVALEGPSEQRPGITSYEALGDLLEALDDG